MKLSNHVEKVWNWGNQNGLKLPPFLQCGALYICGQLPEINTSNLNAAMQESTYKPACTRAWNYGLIADAAVG